MTITARMIRDLLHFKGPLSYGDLLTMAHTALDISNLTAAINTGLERGDFKTKAIQVEGFTAEVFYTEWKE